MLGRAVGGAPREAALARHRGDVDQVTPPARQEPRQRQLRADDDAVEVDVDHPLRGRIGLVDERADRHDPGVVDEDVERAEPALNLDKEGFEAGAVGDVECQADGAAAELGSCLLGQRGLDVADRDPGALRDQRGRRRPPDSPCSAGDSDDLAGERSWSLGHVTRPPEEISDAVAGTRLYRSPTRAEAGLAGQPGNRRMRPFMPSKRALRGAVGGGVI